MKIKELKSIVEKMEDRFGENANITVVVYDGIHKTEYQITDFFVNSPRLIAEEGDGIDVRIRNS